MPYTTLNGDNALHQFPEGKFIDDTDPNAVAGHEFYDSAGVALAAGDTVTITGTVVAVDPRAAHFDGITVRLTNPTNATRGPLYQAVYKFHASQLTKS